jgi:ABC-type transporter Mla MlaB component
MWMVRKSVDSNRLVLGISGRIEEGQLPQLTKALVSEAGKDGVILDLKDVKLVDQACVTFLASCEADGWTLCNCPPYIRAWIDRQDQQGIGFTD